MPSSRMSDANALMGMMERFLDSNATCECPDCKKSTQKVKRFTTPVPKRADKDNSSPSRDQERHLCAEHRAATPPRKASSRDKDKQANGSAPPLNRADKVNLLLSAHTVQDVLEVFKSTPSTSEENQLANCLQKVVAQVKTYPESKTKIMEYCNDESVELDAVFGLLAKFRQERSILTSALIASNSDREKAILEREKALQAIHEVNELMYVLRDVAKEGKGPGVDDVRHSLGNLIYKIHELAKTPSSLYDELVELRDDYDEQMDRFRDVECCHEKLHEDKKKLQDDIALEKREHLDTRRKLSGLQSTKNEVNQAHKTLDKVNADNAELKQQIARLNADFGKINALKHENTQLKKKLAALETEKTDNPRSEKPGSVTQQTTKKRKGKKGADSAVQTQDQTVTLATDVSQEVMFKPDPGLEKEVKSLQTSKSEIQSQLDTAQSKLRQLESVLKKAEVAKQKAVEKQQVDQATAENWKELSQGHQEESQRLKEQLDESMTNASNLQGTVHRLEQAVAEMKDQLNLHKQKRPSSPSSVSQTSATSRIDNDSIRMLRRLRAETAQLVQDLDTARNYPGDPWNLVDCTRNMIAAIEQDIESLIHSQRDTGTPSTIPDSFISHHARSDPNLSTPLSMPRAREATPPLSGIRPAYPASHRPLLPPGLADPTLGRASPKPQLPSPIGTGRPARNPPGLTASPVQATHRPALGSVSGSSTLGASEPATSGIGNGASGVDWSIWSRR